jgi:3D (Asp-Asp-Asp) domain-containing protein
MAAIPRSSRIRVVIFCLALSGCARGKHIQLAEPPSAQERNPARVSIPVPEPAPSPERTLRVTAAAYNSTVAQTDSRPAEAAWGDSLVPGLRAIAISRDLIPLGLGQGVTVRIEGLEGEFTVLDKMDARWRKRIDVYFGKDVAAARQWGEKQVVIRWSDTASVHPRTGRALAAEDSLRD